MFSFLAPGKKYLPIILLMLVAACSSCALNQNRVSTADDATDAVERAVLIETECRDPNTGEYEIRSWGSGVAVRDNVVVTAYHVVNNKNPACRIIAKRGGQESLIRISQRDEENDLAWLYTPGLYPVWAPVRIRDARLGEPIICAGYSAMPGKKERFLSVTRGEIATLDVEGMYRFTAAVLFGHSGGACYGEDGSLLLIVQRGWFSPWGGPYHGYYYGRRP